MILYKHGDLMRSDARTLVNTVNCVGVMGKGIALRFRREYPAMYFDYLSRCEAKQVRLGEPYVFTEGAKQIVNFPTKRHWRGNSDIASVRLGLEYLRAHLDEWQIRSIAVPPLGCGNGGLEWSDVRPLIEAAFEGLDVDVEIYEPDPMSRVKPAAESSDEATVADPMPLETVVPIPEQQLLFSDSTK